MDDPTSPNHLLAPPTVVESKVGDKSLITRSFRTDSQVTSPKEASEIGRLQGNTLSFVYWNFTVTLHLAFAQDVFAVDNERMTEATRATPYSRMITGAAKGRPVAGARSSGDGRSEVASTELARKINRDIILELLRLRQPISRVDLARASGLQNSTVSSIVEQLMSEGWIREGEALKTPRGRRPTLLTLNDHLAMLVADVHPRRAVIAVVDLNGQILTQQEVKVGTEVKASITLLGESLAALRNRHSDRTFMGVGVCLPGRIHHETGRLVMAPNLHWADYDIRSALAQRLEMNVELENDANACLLSELWFGRLDGVSNAVLLAISEGVGASLLADGQLVSGRRGLAGEFGHISVAPFGPYCGCGRRGCWEVFASCGAALRYYDELAQKAGKLDYQELSRLALAGDSSACAAIERQAEAIGNGMRMVTAALSPEIILFAGDISHAWTLLAPAISRQCKQSLLAGMMPRIGCTGDGQKAHLLGAAAVVLQRHSQYYRSRPADQGPNAQLAGKR